MKRSKNIKEYMNIDKRKKIMLVPASHKRTMITLVGNQRY